MPLSLLTAGGRPVGDFWFRAQDKYAELHGTREMKTPIKVYNSKGTKMRNRDERHTLTSFARKRLQAVHEFVAGSGARGRVVPAGEGADLAHPLSVASLFSDAPFDLEAVRACQAQLKAEQDAFQKVYDKATTKVNKKKATARALQNREPGARRWSAPTRTQIRKAQQKRAALRAKLSLSCFRRPTATRLSFGAYVQRVGSPLHFCPDASHLEGRALADMCDGKPLSTYCFTGSLARYVLHPGQYRERVFLVPSLVTVAPAVQVAAVLMGARLQIQACVPALHFWRLARTLGGLSRQGNEDVLTLACSAEFAQAEKEIVAVCRAAGSASRASVWGVRWMTLSAFSAAAPKKAEPQSTRVRFTLFCVGADDASLPRSCRHVARTVQAFVRLAKHKFASDGARRR